MRAEETAALVGAAQRGDSRALDELLRGCLPLVYNVAARTLEPADADDVVQETMLRAVAALPRLRRPDRFRSWLMAIAVRETRRRGGRLGAYRQQFVPVDTDDLPLTDPVDDVTVQRLEVSRQRRELAAATDWLEPDDRELLQLWWLVQAGAMTRQDLVGALGLVPAHARVRLQRLRGRLETARLIVAAVASADRPGGCERLRHLVRDWDGRPSSVWRKRLARHVTDCRDCGAAGADLLAPERLLAVIPLLVPPVDLLRRAVVHPVPTGTVVPGGAGTGARHALLGKPAVAALTALVVVAGLSAAYLHRDPGSSPVTVQPSAPGGASGPPAASGTAPAATASVPAGASNGGPAWPGSQLPPTQGGRYLYVSGTGSDRADGLSRAAALRTLRRAAQLTLPGDTVLVDDGEYSDAQQSAVLPIERSGTARQWITWAAYPGARPLVRATSWQGIHVHAAYIIVSGFTVVGSREQLSAAQLTAARGGDVSDPQISSNCIAVDDQRTADPPRRPHHVVVWGNTVTDCPLSGISTMLADHVTVAYNVAARNGYYSPFGGSGISVHSSWDSDGTDATKMIVRGNVTHDNVNLVPCLCSGTDKKITDGNGIIVESDAGAYRGRTLVENNIAFGNGGRGVNVFRAAHVDVVNNTLYHNAASPSIEADLAVVRTSDVRVLNNIVVARDGRPAVTVSDAAAAQFGHNLIVGRSSAPRDPDQLAADPAFTAPSSGDFQLSPGSPAIDSGGTLLAPASDANRSPRVGNCDRGALEAH